MGSVQSGRMQSTAKDVTPYMEEVPLEQRETLSRLRELCWSLLTDFEDAMDYGGPCDRRNGEVEEGLSGFKPHEVNEEPNFIFIF